MNTNILATTTYQAGKAENKPALTYGSSNLTYLHCSSKPTPLFATHRSKNVNKVVINKIKINTHKINKRQISQLLVSGQRQLPHNYGANSRTRNYNTSHFIS